MQRRKGSQFVRQCVLELKSITNDGSKFRKTRNHKRFLQSEDVLSETYLYLRLITSGNIR